MRKPKIYLDTSVLSHLDQKDVPEKMNDTLKLWEDIKQGYYDVFISEVTLDEINKNSSKKRKRIFEYLAEIDYNLVQTNEEIDAYAKKLNAEGILSEKHYADCLHIACAVVHECSIIISWNFKHMVKAKTVNGVRYINLILGYHSIDIYTPNMLID